jgi:GNAT superfamily N-acetyltransferase
LKFARALDIQPDNGRFRVMATANPTLPIGYSPVPAGHVANVVTFLEMTSRPAGLRQAVATDLSIRRWREPDLAAYRHLFKAVGENWLWQSRLVMPDDGLLQIIRDPDIEIYRLFRNEAVAGLLELDFATPPECELCFIGVLPEEIGKGSGRFLMAEAIARAWARPISRFWVHTCTFDHPAALQFYKRAGFTPYQMKVEVHADPRLTGHMPRSAAPHVPIIERQE